jgi:hypothetical protein
MVLRSTVVETRLYETIFDVHILLGIKLGIQKYVWNRWIWYVHHKVLMYFASARE